MNSAHHLQSTQRFCFGGWDGYLRWWLLCLPNLYYLYHRHAERTIYRPSNKYLFMFLYIEKFIITANRVPRYLLANQPYFIMRKRCFTTHCVEFVAQEQILSLGWTKSAKISESSSKILHTQEKVKNGKRVLFMHVSEATIWLGGNISWRFKMM